MRNLLMILPWLLNGSLFAQVDLSWESLEHIEIDYEQDLDNNLWIMLPQFGEELEGLDGREVRISGYLLPTSVGDEEYALSAFPFSSCFFCGGAGPESVMDLVFRRGRRFSTDDFHRICGTFRLIRRGNTFVYRLENAVLCD